MKYNDNYTVYNPNNKPIEELPVIMGFNNGGGSGFMMGQLIAQDGTPLGSHMCSNEGFMLGDLGIYNNTRPDRHKTFAKHYPDGYRMDFVSKDNINDNKLLQKAFELNKLMKDEDKPEVENASVTITVDK